MRFPAANSLPRHQRNLVVAALALIGLVVWATGSILAEMANRWELDPTYSHGYLVPLIGLLLLWMRRDSRPDLLDRPSWWALLLFLAGVVMQFLGGYLYVRWLAGASLVAYLAGVAALIAGWPGLRWSSPALVFLFFMIPLPYRFEILMRAPLQKISTLASTFALQTLGLPAVAQGHVIMLSDSSGKTYELGVVDACSGLKMLIVFFCLTTAFAILVKRPLGERLLILLSTLPIAVVCNIARITATGVLYVTAGEKLAELVFHDLAGWLMMPLALLLLWLELKLMSLLFIDETLDQDPTFHLPGAMPGLPRNVKATG